jgi:uroporphyrinogen-III decarboxylase
MGTAMTGRALVRGAFERADLPRLPFLPWVFTHAARLGQIPVKRLYTEPTQYVKCLQNARKLYGYDGIATGLDASPAAELAGGPITWDADDAFPVTKPLPGFDAGQLESIDVEKAATTGRFGTVIESLRRIKMVAGANLALAAAVPGPLALAATLTGGGPGESLALAEPVAAFLLKIVQVLCQLEPDIIVVADPMIGNLSGGQLTQLEGTLAPLVNTVRFYNAFSVLVPGAVNQDTLGDVMGLGFDGIAAPGIDIETRQAAPGGRSCALGLAVPSETLLEGGDAVKNYLGRYLPGGPVPGVFVTTEGDVPPATPPDSLRAVMELVSGTE